MGIAPCCETLGKKSQLDNNQNNLNNKYSLNMDIRDSALASSVNNNIQSQNPVSSINENMLKSSTISFKTNETIQIQNTPSINNSIKSINQQSPFKCIKSFVAHNNKIVSLIELYNGLIATGSYDSTIKIWDINSQQLLKIINEAGNVLCLLEFEPGKILSGTDQNVINLWDINNSYNQSLSTFEGHLLWVNCLVKCNENYFASGSNDSDIRIWGYQERECVNVLKGHNNCVLSMVLLRD
jgi:WD40 repeat protein